MSKFTQGKWKVLHRDFIVGVVDEDNNPIELTEENARLIAAAPEMYRLLTAICEIEDQKAWASGEKNDPAFMMALVAQHDALKATKALLARIDGNETEGEH